MHVRSIFISDVHLGTRGCQAERLLDFLQADYESDNLFLVGDIIDFWSMNRGIHWTPAAEHRGAEDPAPCAPRRAGDADPGQPRRSHARIRRGFLRRHRGSGNEHIHVAADGKRYLLLHGDEFDQVTRYHRWLAVLGDVGYNLLVRINATLSRIRRLLNRPGYWSLAGYAKRKVKRAVSLHFRLRGFADPCRARTRPGRRDLRPHPQCRATP
jgi:UDP-2,3-diacylglucosamine pyrophosphatase LpxH